MHAQGKTSTKAGTKALLDKFSTPEERRAYFASLGKRRWAKLHQDASIF
jgi:hypothetical protein